MSNTSPIEKFVEELSEEEMTDFVLIVASQDPTEIVNSGPSTGKARWNSDQRTLIAAASSALDEAGLDLPDSTR
jgi:hypothetical protein